MLSTLPTVGEFATVEAAMFAVFGGVALFFVVMMLTLTIRFYIQTGR